MAIKESSKYILEAISGVLILLLALILGIFFRTDDVKETEKAMKTQKNLLELRLALEEYYNKTEKYPKLEVDGSSEDLKRIPPHIIKNKRIYFKDVYGKEKIESTEATDKLEESNKINIIENLENATLDGGWNYNPSIGEIHANLPKNIYLQNINWSEE